MTIMRRLVLLAAAVALPISAASAESGTPAVNPPPAFAEAPPGWVRESARVWLRIDVPNSATAWRQVNARQWLRMTQEGG